MFETNIATVKHKFMFDSTVPSDLLFVLIENLSILDTVVCVEHATDQMSLWIEYEITSESFHHICEVIRLHQIIVNQDWFENMRDNVFNSTKNWDTEH